MSHDPGRAAAPGRRTFLQWAWLWTTVIVGALATAAVGVPLVGFLLGALRKKREEWAHLGALGEFPLGHTRRVIIPNPMRQPWDGQLAKVEVFVRFEGVDGDKKPQFLVLAVNCAHLGCPVSWFEQSGLFMCPCHGGVYDANGQKASGPPPRGLFKYEWEVRDGELYVRAPHYPTLQDPLRPGDTGQA